LTLTLWAVAGLGIAAGASPIVGGGLAQSIACPDGASPCSSNADFALDPPTPVRPATGSITFGVATADILLTVPTYTMTGSSGSVTSLVFSSVSYAATVSTSAFDFGGGVVQINQAPGFATGSASGSYDQIGGPGIGPFSDLSVSFSNLSCLLVDGQGQCGFNVGSFAASADFGLDVDGAPYDVVQTFNVIVPEPGSLGLVALGVLALLVRRRAERQANA
jgi:hypothetical protein